MIKEVVVNTIMTVIVCVCVSVRDGNREGEGKVERVI